MFRKVRRIGVVIGFLICTVLTVSGCNNMSSPPVSENEIMLKIQLSVKEDIGLLLMEYNSTLFSGSGGMSNANKTMLKHNELIYYELDKTACKNAAALQDVDTIQDLSLHFSIVTSYCDPNYDNVYPPEYTVSIEPIRLNAHFGESYSVSIAGDKTGGYTASLNQ